MLGKYKDYPCGIHEKHIEEADIESLAKIIDILTKEYILILENKNVCANDLSNQISRYRMFSNLLVMALKNWNGTELAREEKVLQASIYLGSVLEGGLQFFLFAFSEDFTRTAWKKWDIDDSNENFFEELLAGINKYFEQLVQNGSISAKQKKDLFGVISREIELRKEGRYIDYIMLDELIGFFRSNQILENKTEKTIFEGMTNIKNGRNSIHVFTKYAITSEEELIHNLKAYCRIMRDLLFRTRCLDEEGKSDALCEMLLEIPGVNLIQVDDEDNVVGCYGNDVAPQKSFRKLFKRFFKRQK